MILFNPVYDNLLVIMKTAISLCSKPQGETKIVSTKENAFCDSLVS